MLYEMLYADFKSNVPESVPFLEETEKILDLDENDGQHVLFGMAVEKYVHDRLVEGDVATISKIAAFMEKMETDNDTRVVDVIDQSVIEHLISTDRKLVAKYDDIWGPETKRAFSFIGQWFIN